LKEFSELKFPANMLSSSEPILLSVTGSVDGKGRVHSAVVSPTGTPFSDAATKTVQKWRFTQGFAGELKAHICIGRQDDGQGIGLPCYVYGPETSAHLRLLFFSSSDLKIETPFRPHLSALAQAKIRSDPNHSGVWAGAMVLIGEDGSVLEARSSGEIVDQELASQMKATLRFRPVHLSGHVVEAVAFVFLPV
jgi:hypothetical protein